MEITITIRCTDVIDAQNALQMLRTPVERIAPKDNPEAGVDYPPGVVTAQVQQVTSTNLANVGFGQGVTLPPGATPALSTADAAAPSTAPAAPPATSTPTAPAASTVPAAPPASAAPVAPPAPAAGPTAPAPGVDLDKTGLPWDARIHASTKSKKQDGTWTALRGSSPELRATVETELRQLMALNAAAAPVQAPAAAPVPVAPPPQQQAAQVPVARPAAGAPAAPVAPEAPTTFAALMERLAPLMEAGKITPARIGELLTSMGVAGGFGKLAMAPNLVPQFFELIKPEILAAELGL